MMHPEKQTKTGILLVNLGTPDEPTSTAVRRYLAEFLHDKRVVDLSRAIWCLILHGVILRFRPKKVAKNYQKIWLEAGSPLLVYSQSLTKQLQQQFEQHETNPPVVRLAMRYGNPSIPQVLSEFREMGVRKLIVLPLYPQYSATTTATVFDAIAEYYKNIRFIPELHFVQHYADNDYYIQAQVNQIKAVLDKNPNIEKLLFSFHGIPKRYFDEGDPYYCFCHKTTRLITEKLGLAENQWQMTFQSRFGREPWLQPYTDITLQTLAREGVKNIAVVCPGFAVDCLETLEEIDMVNRALFLEAGGHEFHYIPALNSNEAHVTALRNVLLPLLP